MNTDHYSELYLGDWGNVMLNGQGYGFPGHIRQVLAHNKQILVLLHGFRDRTSDEDLFSNVFAFDLGSGNLLWRIEPCPQKMRGYPIPYIDLHIHHEKLYVRGPVDNYNEIDTETGKVKFVGQSLPQE